MTERFDASAQALVDALGGRKSLEKSDSSRMFGARGFSALMYREASVRPSTKPAGVAADDMVLGGLYLPPHMRRALAALLRGDHVTTEERLALSHAVSLLPAADPVAGEAVEDFAPEGRAWRASGDTVWPGLEDAANSNDTFATRVARGLVVPFQPERSIRDVENPVLRGLGLKPKTPDAGE